AKNPLLQKILTVLGGQIFHGDVEITHLMLLKLSKTQFYHGSCFIQGRMAAVFFFEDIDMGMACVQLSNEVRYARFSSTLIEGHHLDNKTSALRKDLH
ncbi:MAG: hypothetical protein KDC99_19645, partial [Cyclobacteriaceae bacterium]|nr:hypothetical protein [Cyclobacteriaceae bacterium]